jgi:aerobic-type carbon monoxide dehydrogenase small subunit (CoxS/CutS family)
VEVEILSKHTITFVVNRKKRTVRVDSNETLLQVLRNRLGLKGVKDGCASGDCGACAVIVDGAIVNSCLMLAVQARNRKIETIEGIGSARKLHPLQKAFMKEGAVQCGFCIPAMILASKNLLDNNPNPSRAEIEQAVSSVLCRCTGYTKITRAIESAASEMRGSHK